MDSDSWFSWISVAVLFLCAAYFAAAETSMTSVGRIRLKMRLEQALIRHGVSFHDDHPFPHAPAAIRRIHNPGTAEPVQIPQNSLQQPVTHFLPQNSKFFFQEIHCHGDIRPGIAADFPLDGQEPIITAGFQCR